MDFLDFFFKRSIVNMSTLLIINKDKIMTATFICIGSCDAINSVENSTKSKYLLNKIPSVNEAVDFLNSLSKPELIDTFVVFDTDDVSFSWINGLRQCYKDFLLPNYIVISSDEVMDDVVLAYQNGASLFVKKPINFDSIFNLIEQSKLLRITQKKMNDAYYNDQTLSDEQFKLLNLNLDQPVSEFIYSDLEFKIKQKQSQGFLSVLSKCEKTINAHTLGRAIKEYLQRDISALVKPKVLVVEDEILNSKIVTAELRDYFEIIPALTGEQAVDALHQHSDVGLILLDVYLPDTTGIKLYDEIVKTHANASVIVFTAFEENEVARLLIHKGAYDYINKPYELDVLLSKLLKGWLRFQLPFLDRLHNLHQLPALNRAVILDILFKQANCQGKPICNMHVYALFPEFLEQLSCF